MTITTQHIVVGTVAVLLAGPDEMPQRVIVHNTDSAQQIYIGGSDVTTSNGLHVDGKEERELTLNPGEALYGIASNSYTASVWIQRQ